MTVESQGLPELLGALVKAQRIALPEARKVVAKGALNIKKDWQKRWSGHPHFPALPAAISYDLDEGRDWVGAEVGPDKGKPQGALGNLIEFGSVNNAPIPGGLPAGQAEAPRFEQALADLGVGLLADR